jgi:hypothetical protein
MRAAVVPVVAAETMEMEVAKELELGRPLATKLQEAAPVDRVVATVVALSRVSLKVQASVLGAVLAPEVDRPVALVLLVQAMPPEKELVVVVAQVVAIMAGQAAVEGPGLDPAAEDTIKPWVSDILKPESNIRS